MDINTFANFFPMSAYANCCSTVISQLDLALQCMKGNIEKWKKIPWASRGGMVSLSL